MSTKAKAAAAKDEEVLSDADAPEETPTPKKAAPAKRKAPAADEDDADDTPHTNGHAAAADDDDAAGDGDEKGTHHPSSSLSSLAKPGQTPDPEAGGEGGKSKKGGGAKGDKQVEPKYRTKDEEEYHLKRMGKYPELTIDTKEIAKYYADPANLITCMLKSQIIAIKRPDGEGRRFVFVSAPGREAADKERQAQVEKTNNVNLVDRYRDWYIIVDTTNGTDHWCLDVRRMPGLAAKHKIPEGGNPEDPLLSELPLEKYKNMACFANMLFNKPNATILDEYRGLAPTRLLAFRKNQSQRPGKKDAAGGKKDEDAAEAEEEEKPATPAKKAKAAAKPAADEDEAEEEKPKKAKAAEAEKPKKAKTAEEEQPAPKKARKEEKEDKPAAAAAATPEKKKTVAAASKDVAEVPTNGNMAKRDDMRKVVWAAMTALSDAAKDQAAAIAADKRDELLVKLGGDDIPSDVKTLVDEAVDYLTQAKKEMLQKKATFVFNVTRKALNGEAFAEGDKGAPQLKNFANAFKAAPKDTPMSALLAQPELKAVVVPVIALALRRMVTSHISPILDKLEGSLKKMAGEQSSVVAKTREIIESMDKQVESEAEHHKLLQQQLKEKTKELKEKDEEIAKLKEELAAASKRILAAAASTKKAAAAAEEEKPAKAAAAPAKPATLEKKKVEEKPKAKPAPAEDEDMPPADDAEEEEEKPKPKAKAPATPEKTAKKTPAPAPVEDEEIPD